MFTWQFWLIVSGICLIGEILTAGFLIFWFAIGALITMLVSLVIPNSIVQTAVFVISSTLLIFLTRPFVEKFLNRKDKVETNAYSIIGKTGIVTKEINSTLGLGQVKIGSDIWSAKSETSENIPEGSEIEILRIDGVKVIVRLSSARKEEVIH